MQKVLSASYDEVLVDEYQDCTREQHELVSHIGETLPCRIYGDPLQGIFDFGEHSPIDWETDVFTDFNIVESEDTPWRWRSDGNEKLGEWLSRVRRTLLRGGTIDFTNGPNCVEWIRRKKSPGGRSQQNVKQCYSALNREGSVFVIQRWPGQTRTTASKMKGIFQCIEPVTDDTLYEKCRDLEEATGLSRAVVLIDAVDECATKVGSSLRQVRGRLADGKKSRSTKYADQVSALHEFSEADRIQWNLAENAINELLDLPDEDACVYRGQLLSEFRRSIRKFCMEDFESLEDAARQVRLNSRFSSNRTPKHCISRTVLLKGLECDHVLLLDAEDFDRKDLYVALTRARRSVTVVSQSSTIAFEPFPLNLPTDSMCPC